MDEQYPSSYGQGDSEDPREQRRRSGIALLIVIGIILMLWAAIALAMKRPIGCSCASVAPTAATQQVHASWRIYHDPLGLFSMRLPPGWTATASLGSYSEGGPGGSDSGQTETIIFSNPSLGATGPRIEVDAQQSHNAALNCVAWPNETSNFNGYPADTSMTAVIMFESGNAHFQIDETIPGVLAPVNPGGPMNPPTPPPPPPAATVTAERALLVDTLASFHPSAAPLACG